MSFEEWWNTKDYPARCKGNCKEAYEAGLHADVHTDNSAVIAKLEEQIEKMRNCGNCNGIVEGGIRTEKCKFCIDSKYLSRWELRND